MLHRPHGRHSENGLRHHAAPCPTPLVIPLSLTAQGPTLKSLTCTSQDQETESATDQGLQQEGRRTRKGRGDRKDQEARCWRDAKAELATVPGSPVHPLYSRPAPYHIWDSMT